MAQPLETCTEGYTRFRTDLFVKMTFKVGDESPDDFLNSIELKITPNEKGLIVKHSMYDFLKPDVDEGNIWETELSINLCFETLIGENPDVFVSELQITGTPSANSKGNIISAEIVSGNDIPTYVSGKYHADKQGLILVKEMTIMVDHPDENDGWKSYFSGEIIDFKQDTDGTWLAVVKDQDDDVWDIEFTKLEENEFY